MLSRVADSLYWMSRYLERAAHRARVLDANYNLMLNPSKPSTEQRWHKIIAHLELTGAAQTDPHTAMQELMFDASNRSSVIACITCARDNGSQAREQISAEMWEQLNQLYHRVTQSSMEIGLETEPLGILSAIREGAYRFYGVTDSTMNHGEPWHFIQLGKYMERACALPTLLDAVYSIPAPADDLEWVALLSSCSAFEAYCKVYTADLKAEHVAEFLLLHPEFPYTLRHSAEQMQHALDSIRRASSTTKAQTIERIIGRLHASLAYAQIGDIMSRDFGRFLSSVIEQCHSLHTAVHQVYIDYPLESAFEA